MERPEGKRWVKFQDIANINQNKINVANDLDKMNMR